MTLSDITTQLFWDRHNPEVIDTPTETSDIHRGLQREEYKRMDDQTNQFNIVIFVVVFLNIYFKKWNY